MRTVRYGLVSSLYPDTGVRSPVKCRVGVRPTVNAAASNQRTMYGQRATLPLGVLPLHASVFRKRRIWRRRISRRFTHDAQNGCRVSMTV